MIRGTTATFRIKLPYTVGELEWVTMKWWQDGNNGTVLAPLPITKRLSHCSISNIYQCTLSSDILANLSYCFEINNIKYCFSSSNNIEAGNTLRFNIITKVLMVGDEILPIHVLEGTSHMAELTFVNEINDFKELYVSLTAAETMRFSDKHKVKMQLRAQLKSDGRVFGCIPKLITIYPINDELYEQEDILPSDDSSWIVLDGNPIVD